MASISLTYTLSNGSTADATQVMQNYNDIVNGTSDGTKDFSISALTCAGAATFNGNVTLGNSSSDDLTVTASLASTLPIKTTRTYDIGSADLGLRIAYMGGNSTYTVALSGPSAGMSGDTSFVLPTSNGTAYYVLKTDGSGNTSWVPPAPSAASGSDADTTLTVSSARSQVVTPTANRTYTLPTTGVLAGDIFTFVNNAAVNSSNYTIAVNSSGGNLVRTVYPQTSGMVMALQDTPTTAAHWIGLGVVESNWVAWTPTGTWSSNTTWTGFWRRVGEMMEVDFKAALSGAPSGSFTITLPDSKTVKTGVIANTSTGLSSEPFGWGNANVAAVATFEIAMMYSSTTALIAEVLNPTGSFLFYGQAVTATVPGTFASGDVVSGRFAVPITGWEASRG